MKRFFATLLIVFGFAQLMTVQATTSTQNAGKEVVAKLLMQQNDITGSFANMTPEEFLKLTPKQIKAETGKKLKFKQVVALKAAQKAVKKQMKGNGGDSGIDKGVYIILAILIPFVAVGLARQRLADLPVALGVVLAAGLHLCHHQNEGLLSCIICNC